jgi:hypothetical protein
LPKTIKENDHELDNENLSFGNHLEILKVDQKLFHIFQRNYSIIHTSHLLAINFDVLTKVPVWNNSLFSGQEKLSEIKRAMLNTISKQKQFLRTMVIRIKSEKACVDDLLKSLANYLINDASSKIVTMYKRFIDQIDSLVNLLFGLEMKIANLQNSGQSCLCIDCD